MKTKKWFLSKYQGAIRLQWFDAKKVAYGYGTYHETWREAHGALLARQHFDVNVARGRLANEERALKKYERMNPPPEAAT